jgi:hypothetical protein
MEATKQVNHELDALGNPIYTIRAEPLKDDEALYDSKGLIVAIKTKGQILAILEGEE